MEIADDEVTATCYYGGHSKIYFKGALDPNKNRSPRTVFHSGTDRGDNPCNQIWDILEDLGFDILMDDDDDQDLDGEIKCQLWEYFLEEVDYFSPGYYELELNKDNKIISGKRRKASETCICQCGHQHQTELKPLPHEFELW